MSRHVHTRYVLLLPSISSICTPYNLYSSPKLRAAPRLARPWPPTLAQHVRAEHPGDEGDTQHNGDLRAYSMTAERDDGEELRRISNSGTTIRIGTYHFPLPVSPQGQACVVEQRLESKKEWERESTHFAPPASPYVVDKAQAGRQAYPFVFFGGWVAWTAGVGD